jgi:hypothetical protein
MDQRSALQAKFHRSAPRAADYPTDSLKRAQNQSAFEGPERAEKSVVPAEAIVTP